MKLYLKLLLIRWQTAYQIFFGKRKHWVFISLNENELKSKNNNINKEKSKHKNIKDCNLIDELNTIINKSDSAKDLNNLIRANKNNMVKLKSLLEKDFKKMILTASYLQIKNDD